MSGPILRVNVMEHRIKYPFTLHEVEAVWDAETHKDGSWTIPNVIQWKPGVNYSEDQYSSYVEAEGEGFMVITEISRHKLPRPYPTRVFYTRKWIDPDGKEFGNSKLHITALGNFNKIIDGYFGEEYDIVDEGLVREEKAPTLKRAPF